MTKEKNNFSQAVDKAHAMYCKPWVLRLYDLVLVHISNTWIWKCHAKNMLAEYERHIGKKHLDVGVSSGYYLAKRGYLADILHIMDLSQEALDYTQNRINHANCTSIRHNVFDVFPKKCTQYDSIAFNYILHCIPGTYQDKKAEAITNAIHCLKKGGIFFGSVIVDSIDADNSIARRLSSSYNAKGIFNTIGDTPEKLEVILKQHLKEVEIKKVGNVLLFNGKK